MGDREGICVGAGIVAAGTNATALVVLRDSFGNYVNATPSIVAAANVTAVRTCDGCGGSIYTLSFIPVYLNHSGAALLALSVVAPMLSVGVFDLKAALYGTSIQLSPVSVVVTSNRASSVGSRVIVDDCAPLSHVWAGSSGYINLYAGDVYGNPVDLAGVPSASGNISSWGDLIVAAVPSSTLCDQPADVSLAALSVTLPGWYALRFTAACSGWYTINASILGESLAVTLLALSCNPTISTRVPIRISSSHHVFIAPRAICPLMSVVNYELSASSVLQAGVTFCVASFIPRDVYGNARALPPASGDIFYVNTSLIDSPLALLAYSDGLAGSWAVSSC